MKLVEMRAMSIEQLHQEVAAVHQALFEARMKHALSQLDNTASLHNLRHRVAQLKTVIHEKELAAAGGAS